ncbi:hypothetical protein FHN55_17020 [Streptomyces sp. NP160]|uniref:terminase large subunit domain-containing protein n=1 Tax=Streptomyces sp. NP160 TaxID=2586637 RepID=UPI001117B096|nr:terminase large subunit [Streptomyces sp. NP160]TNM61530.1 hypothetical protein FHN55_17020 [Streptomyces sp. NP160]
MNVWTPTRFTPSLTGTEDFVTDGDRLIRIVEKYWKEEEVEGKFHLDDWQKWLIRHVLERYPDDWPVEELRGRLRFRQVIISMGRQNGKSVLGAIFGVYGLLFHEYSPRVVSLAYSVETAKVIYNRVGFTLNNVKQFKSKVKVTKTSGISRVDGPGKYIVKPASDKAIQGFPITMCLYDEVHITPVKLWSAAMEGTKTKKDGIIIGITTAGDDNSELLKKHYETLNDALLKPDDPDLQRFGGFVWEAPEGSSLEDDDAIRAANPAVASGRTPVSLIKTLARDYPEVDRQRYVLNRFVASVNSWLPMNLWHGCVGGGVDRNLGGPYVYAIDASANMEYATISVSQKKGDKVNTSIIACFVKPTHEQLLKRCLELRRYGSCTFVVDGYTLRRLGEALKERGMKAYILSPSEFAQACITAYRLISRGQLNTRNEDILKQQVPRGVRKNVGDAWRISRADSSSEIDALIATVMSVHVAEIQKGEDIQLFV